jgi:hypothetical protein
LKTTRTYGNVCGIYSWRVEVFGVCEEVEVFLIDFLHINILMDIFMIDVPDSGGCSSRGLGPHPLRVLLA